MGQVLEAVIFDLEFTSWDGAKARGWSGPGEHREVIQIGAVRIAAGCASVLASFTQLVRPRLNPVLSDFITALTGITNADLDRDGVPFAEAYGRFEAFCGAAPLFCYGWDEEVIEENIDLYGLAGRFQAPRTTNLHHFFRAVGLPVDTLNSGALAGHLGLDPAQTLKAHDALADCLSQAAAAGHLIAQGHESPFRPASLTAAPIQTGPQA